MTQDRTSTTAGLVLASALALATSAQAAAPQTVSEIANYTGADRQAVLETGARKDGSVLIYGSIETAAPIFEGFAKKYPYVRIEKHVGDSADVTRKAIEEFKAGHHVVDVFLTSLGGMQPLRDLGFFEPYRSPEFAAMRADSIEPSRVWAMESGVFISLGYNTKEVSEKDVPKTLDDLMDPKWKGKMAVPNSTTLPNWIGAVMHDRGEDFIRKLGTQQIRVYQINGRALSNLVVSGEVPLSPTIFNSQMFTSAKAGASVSWRPLGTVGINTNTIGIAAHALHPSASMLMIDYFLSKEAQLIRHDLGNVSGRQDVTIENQPTSIVDLTASPTFAEDFEKWQRLADQVFGKGQATK
jgi:iron(III) transport system substrate-binding protein